MKRINNLYEKIISIDNLIEADEIARKGKKRSYGVKLHDSKRGCNILELHNTLSEESFKNSEYSVFKIYEPKKRLIYRLPYYPDRVLHHAIMNVLEPIWRRVFIRHTYACIRGRGIHLALKDLKKALRDKEGTRYCLKLDIKKFYPSVDHDILKEIIARKIKDKRLLRLLSVIIDSAPGVPIGNYLSQYFANLYLSYFDHFIKEEKKVKYYYRYADDIVVLSSSKEYLHSLRSDIERYFKKHLKLQVKNNYQVFPVSARGIDFVGYVFFHTHILLRKTIKKAFIKAVKKGAVKGTSSYQSYFGWATHCNSKNLLKKINSYESKQNRCG